MQTLKDTFTFTLEGRIDKSTFSEICEKISKTFYERFNNINAEVKSKKNKIIIIITHLTGIRKRKNLLCRFDFEYLLSERGLRVYYVNEDNYKITV